MAQEAQSFKNHARNDPAFHFFLIPLLLLLLIEEIVHAIRNPTWYNHLHIVVVIMAIVAAFKIRLYALKVQDRVIRLEERLRLKELLPPSLQPRIGELTEGQLIALRFASDGEVAELVQKTLAGNWDRKQIKEAIQVWRPDNWRV